MTIVRQMITTRETELDVDRRITEATKWIQKNIPAADEYNLGIFLKAYIDGNQIQVDFDWQHQDGDWHCEDETGSRYFTKTFALDDFSGIVHLVEEIVSNCEYCHAKKEEVTNV